MKKLNYKKLKKPEKYEKKTMLLIVDCSRMI